MNDRYQIKEKIGQGGIGAVYRAYDSQLKREVAIKRLLPADEGHDVPSGQVMMKEATTLSALQHPNIITVYDVGMDDDGGFVVMELLRGETLDQVVQRGVLTLKDFNEVVSQTMEALIAAETAGVLHRDLKPTNVMVSWLPSKKFQVKILDFSLAKFSRVPAPQTIDQGDAIFGSIYFMAPEQFERGNLDKRTDLYSMGCLYYYCLAGQYPFQGESAAQVMASHLQGTVIPLETIRPDLPPVICQWVMWMINRYAKDRPQDAREAFENYQQITETLDPSTSKITLAGASTPSPLNATSRRLIVPPPAKTDSVKTAIGEDVEAGTGRLTTSVRPLQTAERERKNQITYLAIILGVLAIVAGVLGVKFLLQKSANDRALAQFQLLAAQESPRTHPKDVHLLVRFLDDDLKSQTGAREILSKLSDVQGGKDAIDEEIISALAATQEPLVQSNLIKVIKKRGIAKAEPELLKLVETSEFGNVRGHAVEALGVIGDDATLKELLAIFSHSSDTPLPQNYQIAIADLVRRSLDVRAATKLIGDLIQNKPGKLRHSLIKTLGNIGGSDAISIIGPILYTTDSELLPDRRAALEALKWWPTRNRDVSGILEHFLASIDIDPQEQQRGLEAYLALSKKNGREPTENEIHEFLLDQIIKPGEVYLNTFRESYLRSLRELKDTTKALELATKLREAKTLQKEANVLAAADRLIKELQ